MPARVDSSTLDAFTKCFNRTEVDSIARLTRLNEDLAKHALEQQRLLNTLNEIKQDSDAQLRALEAVCAEMRLCLIETKRHRARERFQSAVYRVVNKLQRNNSAPEARLCVRALRVVMKHSQDSLVQDAMLQKEKAESHFEQRVLCVICMTAERAVRFSPCAHCVCCIDCTKKLLKETELCPMCRVPIRSFDGVILN